MAAVATTALVVLVTGIVLAQDASTDPRLSAPAFIALRDEAIATAECADRRNVVLVSRPKAKFSDIAIRDHVQGRATVEGIVMTDGSVRYTRVLKADNPALGTAALEQLEHSEYKSATCKGQPVPAIVALTLVRSIQ